MERFAFGATGSLLYTLHGIVVHDGTMAGGHYYAYVKAVEGPIGRWYKCNDSRVSEATEQEVLDESAYMLFYSKIV